MSLGTRSLKTSNGDLSLISSIDPLLPMKSGIECILDMPLDACAETGVALRTGHGQQTGTSAGAGCGLSNI